MGAYRYLLFPRHQQPTLDEAEELRSHGSLLKNRYAIGHERKTEALAILFEQEAFENAMADVGFELLIRKWQVHGCELVDKLKFVKDSNSLRPTHSRIKERHLSHDRIVHTKQYMAQEAIAKSLLNVQRTLERISWLQRIGKGVPYALIALGTIGLIVVGCVIYGRIETTNRERRKDTVERVSNDAMNQPFETERVEPIEHASN